MIYLKYLKSLLLHKWYVFLAGLVTGVPLWRLIIHDWSKFTPSEFIPYAQNFYGDYPKIQDVPPSLRFAVISRFKEDIELDFDYAWLHHQKYNPHHWQYWILVYDEEKPKALIAPETYVREMVADWLGASKAYSGSWNMAKWLNKNGPKMILHEETERRIDLVLTELGYFLTDNCMWSYMWSGAKPDPSKERLRVEA